MLQHYFARPTTVDRIRGTWLAAALEQYVAWMREHRYSTRCVIARVPALIHFGEFARDRGAATWDQLPEHVEPFIEHWVRAHYRRDHKGSAAAFARRLRRPIQQFLGVITPAAVARPARPEPLAARVPGYFDYLRTVCGLRERSLGEHRRLLRLFEAYLDSIGLRELRAVSPAVLGGFVTTIGAHYGKRTVQRACAVLKGVNGRPTLTSDRRPTLTMPWGGFGGPDRGPALGIH